MKHKQKSMKPFQFKEPKSSKTLQVIYSVVFYFLSVLILTMILNVISGVTPENPTLPSWGVGVFWVYTLTLWYVPYRYFKSKNDKLNKPQTF
jgi:hypothetical protein